MFYTQQTLAYAFVNDNIKVMKVSKDIVNQRRIDIMRTIEENSTISVEELCKKYKVSSVTIRRDLDYWENQGAVVRSYGNVSLVQAFVKDNDYAKIRFMKAIAKRAALYIEDGDVIFINSSRTATMVMNYVKNKRVTIITNHIQAAGELDDGITLIYTGGEVKYPYGAMTGDFTLASLNNITANKCFIGCSGLTEDCVSTGIMKEMLINQTMLNKTAGLKFILCDHTKVGIDFNFHYADYREIDYLITDVEANKRVISKIKEKNSNLNIVAVEPLKNVD